MRWLVCLLAACAVCSCKKAAVTNNAVPGSDNILARIGSEVITVQDFQEAMRARPVGNDPAARNALLDELVEFRALVDEAKARGYDRDPQMRHMFERLLANRMRAELEGARPEGAEIPPEEVVRYYREHEKDFTVPTKIRVAMIFVEAPITFTEEKRKERRARIDEARAKASGEATPSQNSKQIGFGPLAAEYSFDQATKYKGGDLGYLVEGLTGADADTLEPQVTAAAFALTEPGQLSDIIETPKGYSFLKLEERYPGSQRPLTSVRNEILAHLRRERAANTKVNFAAQLLAGRKVEIQRERLATIPPPSNAETALREHTPAAPSLPRN